MDTNSLISAIVCTHNRAALLNDALASLANQTMDKEKYEVIIVDNASTDNTREVVARWVEQQPNFRYIYEPNLGLSHARNRGAIDATAPIVAFMDDDCVAETTWLQGLLKDFGNDNCTACLGGRIRLRWEGGVRPPWIPDNVLSVFGYLDLGEQPQQINHANGGNMAWDRRVLLDLGGFQPDLGRTGNLRLAGEESQIQQKARQRGLLVCYAPHATVCHYVPIERQSRRHILQTCFMIGVSASIADHLNKTRPAFFSFRRLGRRILNALPLHVHAARAFMRDGWPLKGLTLYWLHLCAISWGAIVQDVRFLFGLFAFAQAITRGSAGSS
jgi:glycosyltransferase involved in cell wall biosynthesis